jgi:Tfp pilus assembly protein PilX
MNTCGQYKDTQHAVARLNNQRGSTLVFGMILLLVLTILGVASTGSSQLELKMAANALDKSRSFEKAEDARTAAEQLAIEIGDYLRADTSRQFDCSATGIQAVQTATSFFNSGSVPNNGFYASDTANDPVNGLTNCGADNSAKMPPAYNLASLNAMAWDDSDSIANAGDQDRYIIEYLGTQDVVMDDDPNRGNNGSETETTVYVFRLTVRGIGVDGAATYVQAVYMR